MATDINELLAQLRQSRRQRVVPQPMQQADMSQMGAPSMGGGGQNIAPQRNGPMQTDFGSAAPDQNTMNAGQGLADMIRGAQNNPAIMSKIRGMMGNTGLPGSGSMLGGSSTGTLANAGATQMGAGISPTVGGSVSFPGAQAAGAASGAGGLGGMMSGAGAFAWPAAIVAALDKTGISSFKDTMKGRAGSNIMERLGIRKEGGGAVEQMGKGVLQAMGGDFGGAWKNTRDSVKNIFKLKLF